MLTMTFPGASQVAPPRASVPGPPLSLQGQSLNLVLSEVRVRMGVQDLGHKLSRDHVSHLRHFASALCSLFAFGLNICSMHVL